MDDKAMLAYALATECDAITMYRHMIKNMPDEYRKQLLHILKEEKEHAQMLSAMIKSAGKE